MKKIIKKSLKVLNIAITVLLAVILLSNLYTLAARKLTGKQSPTVFGFSSAVVLTGSMQGAINPNDMIITKSQRDYSVGDIVMYEGGTATVTHRIISVSGEGYLTKGDANNTDDGTPIPQEKIVGKVVLIIPKIGSAISFIRSPLGMLIALAFLFALIEIPNLINLKNI